MKSYVIIAIVSAAIGATVTKLYYPTLQTVTETKEVVRNNVVTEIHEVIRTDGSKETITVVIDKTVKKGTSSIVAVIAPKLPQYHASISASRAVDEIASGNMVYGAQIDYAILGPISLGLRVDSTKQIGLVVGVAF